MLQLKHRRKLNKRLSIVFVLLLAMGRLVASSGLDFLDQDMNQRMRDYCYHMPEYGFVLKHSIDGAVTYQGTIIGVENTEVMVLGAKGRDVVGGVLIMFPSGKLWAGDDDYDILCQAFIGAYGMPHVVEEDGIEAQTIWQLQKVIVSINRDDKGELSVIFYNSEVDELGVDTEKNYEEDENSILYNQAMLEAMKEEYEAHPTEKEYALYVAAYCEKLAQLYADQGWYTMALEYYNQSLDYVLLYEGKEGSMYATTLLNISVVCSDMGDLKKAILYINRAMTYVDRLFEDKPETKFLILRAASSHYEHAGMYEKSEELNNRMLREMPNYNWEDKDELYVTVLQDQATLSLHMGDHAKARAWLDQEIAFLRQTTKEPDAQYALCYSGYGVLDIYDKEYERGAEMFKKGLSNLPDMSIRKNQLYAGSLYDNLSICYAYMGRADEAIVEVEKALDVFKNVYTEHHYRYASALNDLAFAYYHKGDYTNALKYSEQALTIFEQAQGKEHLHTMTAAYNVGGYSSSLGNLEQAETYFRRSIAIAKKNYQHALDYMSEYQRERFWSSCHELLERPEMTQFIYYHYAQRPSIAEFAYDNELFNKGLLLASTEMVRRSIEQSGDADLIARYERLSDLKEQIYHMEQNGVHATALDSCRQVADALEKEVTKQSAAFRQSEAMWQVDWRDVENSLKPKQLAIEMTRIPLSEDSVMYAALLLRHGDAHPLFVPLFEEKEVSDILLRTTPDEQYAYDQAGGQLCYIIWAPLLKYLHFGDTIYCAATGVLHQVAFETLPFSGELSISSMFPIVRVSSTRELVMNHTPELQRSAVLYGGIYYDMEMDDLLAQSESYAGTSVAVNRAVTDESLRAGVHYLPGTKREVDAITSILRPQQIEVKVYSFGAANEESFKALNGRHTNILHIATHGFYWTDSTAREQRYFTQRSAAMDNMQKSIDPLNRSGLLFAGANIALRGHSGDLPQNVQDGILTAKEISLLDLRGADLVILSACETGKGEVTGEGVFGLQRAFKMAGAQTILMSLWPVDDAATQLMTTEFYRHWIGLKEGKREAFRHAQETVREQYPQPRFWAAFILLD